MIWLIPWAVAILLMAIQFAHIKKWLSDHNKRRENRMKDYITDVSDEHKRGTLQGLTGIDITYGIARTFGKQPS